MLNLCGSSSSASYQFLVFESPLFQVIFMKNHAKNSLFEGLCHKGLELFSKTNFESSWAFEGLKICKSMYFVHRLLQIGNQWATFFLSIKTTYLPKISGEQCTHTITTKYFSIQTYWGSVDLQNSKFIYDMSF